MTKTQLDAVKIIAKRIRQACNNSDHYAAEPLTENQICYFRTWVLPTLDTLSKESKFQTLEEKEALAKLVRFDFN